MTVSSNRMLTTLRLLAECGERPEFTYVGRPAEEFRRADEIAERVRTARRELIVSQRATNARTGLYVVPCRPDILYIPNAPVWATQVASP